MGWFKESEKDRDARLKKERDNIVKARHPNTRFQQLANDMSTTHAAKPKSSARPKSVDKKAVKSSSKTVETTVKSSTKTTKTKTTQANRGNVYGSGFVNNGTINIKVDKSSKYQDKTYHKTLDLSLPKLW